MKNSVHIILLGFLVLCFFSCSEETLDDNATGTITGTVVLQGSNNPVENARISTNPSTSTVFTNAEGDFMIPNVPTGDYTVQAQKDSLVAQFEGASVLANSEVNVIFEMRHQSTLNVAPSAPMPIAPQDNEEELDPTVNFVWSSSETDSDMINYTLKIRNANSDETLLFENITDTTHTVEGLHYDETYFWQVSASDEISPMVWSEVHSFQTKVFPEARILFTRTINGNKVIFALDDEGNEFQLTSSSQNSFRPRKNNTTNKVAFLRTIDGQTQLFTMNPDGSQIFQVTNTIPVRGFNMNMVDFSWAENGNALVYPSFEKLYRVSTTGAGTNQIYETPNGRFITEVDVSEDNSKAAIITNNSIGYNASIQTIDMDGNVLDTILENQDGAVGGLDLSVDGQRLLYTRDVSGYESLNYRQLDSRMFIYDFNDDSHSDISLHKEDGTNDLDPRFSPNEAIVVFVNTDNDGISPRNVMRSGIQNLQNTRELIEENAQMPDWE